MAKPLPKTVFWIWLTALLLFPIILWILPAGFFDDRGIEMCPSKAFFDIECFGCGITRAIMHFHHFDFTEAVYYNTLVIGVYPFLVWLWFRWTRYAAGRLDIYPFRSKAGLAAK